jgi:aspartate carbamoyltransferase catalytic subunit
MSETPAAPAAWTRKDLVGLEELSRKEIEIILDTAPQFLAVSQRESGIKKVPVLQGRLVVNWFYEPSTRTRTSFELAAKRLSADTLSISASMSSLTKGETLHDTLYNIEAMRSDIVVLRHGCAGAPHLLAKSHSSSIINAGDGYHEHPTQALLDAFTIRQNLRRQRQDPEATLDGLKVTIIGDIAHSRVARSNIWGLTKLGAEVTVCGPSTLLPAGVERMGARPVTSLRDAISEADVIYVLRIQLERQQKCLFPSLREYVQLFRIDPDSLNAAPAHAMVLHPGPINRDIELSAEVADGPRNLILDQVTNGVAIRMAAMHLVANRPKEAA